jgi:hypothetical protein
VLVVIFCYQWLSFVMSGYLCEEIKVGNEAGRLGYEQETINCVLPRLL